MVCVLSLCTNAYVVIRHFAQRSSNYNDMAMVPYYLSMALDSYIIEFTKKGDPNEHYQPGNLSVQMAFSSYQASESLYREYGYNTNAALTFLDQLRNASDAQAYHELLSLKSYLPNTFIKPSQIQPLFNAMASEYKGIRT